MNHEIYKEVAADGVTYRVWDRVVRLTHWINVAATIVLIYTGFAIGGMVSRSPVDEPAFGFNMASIRNFHYFFAVVLTMNGIVRTYWFFGGRTYPQWFRFHIWEGDFWKESFWKLKEYATLRFVDDPAHTLGHNALASIAYLVAFFTTLGLVLTGFAMWGQIDPTGWLHASFGWVIWLVGSDANARILHRFFMWILIAFTIQHVGIVLYLDLLGERGLISSIIIGLKIRERGWRPTDKPWKA